MVAFVSGNGLGLFNSSLGVLGGQGGVGHAGLGRSGEQAYVNVASGNLILQRQDEYLAGLGPDINVVRTYNSQAQFNDDNGDNWRLGLHKQLYGLTGTLNSAGSTIWRTDGDGTELLYTYDSTLGAYLNRDGSGSLDTLSWNGSTWLWTDGDTRVTETYDWNGGQGKLLQLADLDGHTLTYSYTGNLLTQVTDASGERTYFDYSGHNLVQIRTVSQDGSTLTRVRYTYDSQDRLASVQVDLTPDDNSIADGQVYTTSYTYDGDSRRIASLTQTDGTEIRFSYTALADGTTRVTQIVQVVEGGNRITTLAYDLANRQTSVTDPLGHITRYRYDTEGRLIQLQGPVLADGQHQSVSYAYDAHGNLVSQTDPLGRTITYQYDNAGNLTLQRDAVGNTITRSYGAANQLLTETVYLIPDADGAGPQQPGQGQTTRYAYDNSNRLRFTVSPEGRVTEYRYNAQGQRTSAIVYTGTLYPVTGLTTDAPLDAAVLAAWSAGSGIDKSQSERTDTSYDFRGQISMLTRYSRTDASGAGIADGTQSVTRYVYDQSGQLLQSIAPNGNATAATGDFLTSYTYDGLGRLLTSTDALGATTITLYDDAGNTTRTTLANGLATTHAYNKSGELISILQADGAAVLGETRYTYDAAGRLRMTQDPLSVRSYILYNAAGRKIAAIDGSGSLTEYVHDGNNNVVQTIRYATAVSSAARTSLIDGAGQPTSIGLADIRPGATTGDRITWQLYDPANRLTAIIDELGTVTVTRYDGASNIVAVTRYATPIVMAGVTTLEQAMAAAAAVTPDAVSDRTTRQFHDNDGRLIAELDADGYLTEHRYDAAGRRIHSIAYVTQTTSVQWATGTLDQLRPASTTQDQHTWTLYDSQGRVTGEIDAEGYLTETLYDPNGNRTSEIRYARKTLIAPGALTAATGLDALRPAAHSQDRITHWTYTQLGQSQTRTNSEGTVTRYTYDNTGNLIQTEHALGTAELRTQQARYDKQGRLIGELSAEGSAALAALAAPTAAQIDAIWAQYGLTHSYDSAGNKTSTTDPNGNRTLYYYDSDGQLRYRINALGEITGYVYNALDQLTQTTRYSTRLASAILASLTGGRLTDAVSSAVAALANAALDSTTTLAYDQRGQIIQRTDELGNTNTTRYNAFGEVRSTTERIDATRTVTTQYDVNRRGLVTQIAEDIAGLNRITQSLHDAFGRVIQTIDAKGQSNLASYDRLGRIVQTTDALGINRSTTYDAFGRVLTQTDGNGHTTTIAYDQATRRTTVTTAEGIQTVTTVNRHGQTVEVKDGRGYTTSYLYDRNGKLLSTRNDALEITEGKRYDNAGQLIESTDPNGVKTIYSYDAAGRILTRTLDPNGLALITTYAYDAKGQAVSVTAPDGVVTRTRYDRKGQVTEVALDPDGLNLRTTYSYDARGNTLTVTEGAGATQPRITQYTYDALGRRIREVRDPNGLAITTQYAYDSNDNLTRKTDANGNVTRYFHDVENRLTHTLDPLNGLIEHRYDNEGKITTTTVYANALQGLGSDPTLADIQSKTVADGTRDRISRSVYDKDGREVFSIDALWGVTKTVYDANGNVLERLAYATPLAATTPLTLEGISTALTSNAAADRSTRSFYDAANRLRYSINAEGGVRQTTYDKAGNVVRIDEFATPVTIAGHPSAEALAAALTSNAGQDRSTRHVYDQAGRQVYAIDAHGYVKETRYDQAGRIVQTIEHGQPIHVGATPTLAEVEAAFRPDTTTVTTTNGSSPYWVDPVQQYPYSETAQLDTATPATETVAVTQQTDSVTGAAPVQPYTYIPSAKQDTASTATQNVTLQVTNTSQTQSASVMNYAWYRSGNTLVTGSGLSIAPGYLSFSGLTEIRASVYKDGVLYATTYTDLGDWEDVYASDGEGGYYVANTIWSGVNNWNGQVNLTTGSLPPGTYTVVLDTRNEQSFGARRFTWYYSNTISVNVGTVTKPTVLSWAASTQPAGTTVSFSYRPAGSSAAYTALGVTTSGSSQQVNPGNLSNGSYEYRIQYTDSYGRIIKSAIGTFTTTAGVTGSVTAAFTYTQVTSTAVAGSSIGGYLPLSEVGSIDYIDATVKDARTGAVVSAARTYPEFEAGYSGQVNLKTGAELANGSYTVTVSIRRKNGTVETKPAFAYEVGPQSYLRTTLSWSAGTQPAGTTASFSYRPAGNTGGYVNVAVSAAGAMHKVEMDKLAAGNYEYQLKYTDSYGRVLKSTSGTVTASTTAGTTNTFNTDFAYVSVNSVAVAGSSISGYIALPEVPTIDKVKAVVKDMAGNVVSTAWTYPEFEPNYSGNLNLRTGSVLPDGRYSVEVTVYYKNGSSTSKPAFDYQIGLQNLREPIQPYPYIANAKQDTASAAIQNVSLQVANSSLAQSANVMNYAWYRSGNTLSTGAGLSIAPGYVSFGDRTPTEVKATIYKDGVLYATTYTNVAYTTQETWMSDEYGPYPVSSWTEGGQATEHWHGVSNWNGQVNLTTGSFPSGTYTVVLSVRDSVGASTYYIDEVGMAPYDGDGTWAYSNTITVNVGTVTKPTVLSWAASTQPAGTTVSFGYRPAGSSAAYTALGVTTSGSTQQVNPGNLSNGSYEYRIQYTDSYGRIIKSAIGTFTTTAGVTGSVTAAFTYTQVTSTAVAGSSIGNYIPMAEVGSIDYIEAVVTDRITGSVVSTARTYPEAEVGYNGQVNLKTGSPLSNGSYHVAIVVRYKNGTVANHTPFTYELGLQTNAHRTTTLSWNADAQPANSTARFVYAPVGSNNLVEANVTAANGKQQAVFVELTGGTYRYILRYIDNATGQVIKEASGQFTVATAGSTTADLTFQTDLEGNAITRSNRFVYDAAGRLTESTDGEGHAERYGYDALGNKTSFTNKKNALWTYSYDALGRLTAEYSPQVAVTNVADNLAVTTQIVSLETRITYDAAGNVLSRTEAYGRPDARTTYYQYDALGRQVKTLFPQVGAYNASADNLSTNGINGIVNRTDALATPSSSVIYDRFGNAIAGIDAAGNYSYKVYDKLGRIKYEIDAERYVTEYDYDTLGNQTSLIRRADRLGGTHADPAAPYTLAVVAALIGTGAAGDRTIRTEYNRLGHAIQVIEPQVYTYDSSAAAESQYFTAGRTTRNVYNAFGQVVRQSVLQNPLTDTWGHSYHYYDRRGNKIAQVDPLGYLTTWTYDADNNLTRQVEYAKALPAGSWNAQGYGNAIVTTPQSAPDSAIGYDREVRFTYDGNNRKIKETRVNVEFAATSGNPSVTKTHGDVSTEYAYDGVGNLIRVIDGNGIATHTYYDVLGRTKAIANPAGANQLGLTVFDYNAHGNATRQTVYANGTASATTSGYAAPVSHGADQVSYTLFDSHGHAMREVDAEGKSRYYAYDIMGRVAKQWQPITDVDGKVQNAIQLFQYDKLGQQTATIEPSYLPNQNLSQITTPLELSQRFVSFNATSAVYGPDSDGNNYQWRGQNSINFSWASMGGWGEGDVTLEVEYFSGTYFVDDPWTPMYYGGDPRTIKKVYSSSQADTGIVMSWDGDGITSISRVRIYKSDSSGSPVLIHDRAVSGAYGTSMAFAPPPQSGIQATFRYRPVSGGAWSSASLVFMGGKYVFDSTAVPAGSYYFEVLYTRPGESLPSLRTSGQFAVNGTTGSVSNTATNVTSYPPPYIQPTSFFTHQVRYNGFGEIVAKGVNGWQEYYDYDNAGHLWRSNANGGADTVYLYNLQGAASAEIRSQQLTLGSPAYTNPQQAAILGSGVIRTDTVYDLNGRVVKQILPSLKVDRSIEASTASITYSQAALNFSVADSAYFSYSEYGSGWGGTNKVNLTWNAMGEWGSGDVRVDIDYLTSIQTSYDENGWVTSSTGGTPKTVSKTFSSTVANTGVAFNWNETNYDIDGGISAIKNVRVYKKDINGNWVLIHNRGASGSYSRQLLIPTPTEMGGKLELNYKAAGGGWTSAPLYNMGNMVFADISHAAAGSYEYEVLYYHKNSAGTAPDTTPYARATGTFTVNGASGTLTQNTAAGNDTVNTLTPVVNQTVDRWGNVLSISNARDAAALTTYRYNDLNQRIRESGPLVDVYGLNGNLVRTSPVSSTYYDKTGRMIATVDANGNTSTARYNTAGQITAEYRPDGSVITHVYNRLGQKTQTTDGNGNSTFYTYDRLDRLKSVQRPIGTEYYYYDEADNRIRQINANGENEYNWYDTRGKLIRTRVNLGQETNLYYDLRGNKIKELNANGDIATWSYDYFGRLLARTDLGGAAYTFSYNQAGLLTAQTSTRGQSLTYTYYENGAVKTINDNALNAQTLYEYDAAGNRTRERYVQAGVTHQDNRISFDNLGRITAVQDNRYTLLYGYDANGNRRFTKTHYYDTAGTARNVENWYLYDGMNRITLSQGALVNGSIQVTASQGIQLSYDAAGNRKAAFSYANGSPVTETYSYDVNHRLVATYRNGQLESSRSYDRVGRVLEDVSGASGSNYQRRINTYNGNGWLTQQETRNGSNVAQSRVNYTKFDQLGNVINYQVAVLTGYQYTNYYRYQYLKQDGYKEEVVYGSSSYFQAGNTTSTYDVNGNLVSVVDRFNANKTRTFVNDQAGHVLNKTENGVKQYYFYVNDKPSGSTGANGNADFDFNYTPVSELYPGTIPTNAVVSQGDTLRSIALAVYGDAQLWYLIADANGLRTDADLVVGKTLVIPNKITNLRNDFSTFKPYSAGEIIGDTTPTLPDPPPPPKKKGGCGGLGAIIAIVVAVVATVLTAGALAGAAAQGLGAMWSAGATALTGGGLGAATSMAASLGSFGTGFVAGAVGSIASQAFGMATGIQDKFSWSGVALAGLGAGVAAGVGAAMGGPAAIENLKGAELFGKLATRAAIGNVITQGVGVVTGLQDKFSWRNVAASAVGATVGAAVRGGLGDAFDDFGKFSGQVARGTISGFAAGAAASIVSGGKLNVVQVATDAFGNALGNSIAGHIGQGGQQEQTLGGGLKVRSDIWGSTRSYGDYSPADLSLTADGVPQLSTQIGAGYLYTAQEGDSAYRIAERQMGDSSLLGAFVEANSLSDPNKVIAGKDYWVPAAGTYDDGQARAVTNQVYAWNARNKEIQQTNAAGVKNSISTVVEQSSYPLDPTDGLRAGPTIERRTIAEGLSNHKNIDWGAIGDWAGMTGDIQTVAEHGVLYVAKNDAQKILGSAWTLQKTRMLNVAASNNIEGALNVFKNQNGKAALALAESSKKYGSALKGIAGIGHVATAAEEGVYLSDVYNKNPDKLKYAVGATVTNVAGGGTATYLGVKGGALAGAWLAPLTGGLSIPIGALIGGIGGNLFYGEFVKQPIRDGWTGIKRNGQ